MFHNYFLCQNDTGYRIYIIKVLNFEVKGSLKKRRKIYLIIEMLFWFASFDLISLSK